MSTAYNRRRGAKANKPRRPRRCVGFDRAPMRSFVNKYGVEETIAFREQCIALAPCNRYCAEHQRA